MRIIRAHVVQRSRSFTWLFAPDTEFWEGYKRLMDFLNPHGIFGPGFEDANINVDFFITDLPAKNLPFIVPIE